VNDSDKRPLPVFDLIAKEFEVIRRRAFDRFEKRGRELGHDLEDWLRAEHELLGWPTDVYRRFEVLKPIDVDKVTANIENGLLWINAPEISQRKAIAARAAQFEV
jgi:hypothetical protein